VNRQRIGRRHGRGRTCQRGVRCHVLFGGICRGVSAEKGVEVRVDRRIGTNEAEAEEVEREMGKEVHLDW
jgi:hypothetical protein